MQIDAVTRRLLDAAAAATPIAATPAAATSIAATPTPSLGTGSTFAAALDAASDSTRVQSQPLQAHSGEFGLSRAIGVIAALRDTTPPVGEMTSAPAAPTAAAATASIARAETTSPAGPRRVELARGELGVTEAPAGSNDGPRIAEYRTAVPGGPVGRWCAYFVSWVARQAGTPLGDRGQGFAAVEDVRSWLASHGWATVT